MKCFGCLTPIPDGAALYCFACRQERAIKEQTRILSRSDNNDVAISALIDALSRSNTNQPVQRVYVSEPTYTPSYVSMTEEEKEESRIRIEKREKMKKEEDKKYWRQFFILSAIIAAIPLSLISYFFGFYWWVALLSSIAGPLLTIQIME